MTQFGVYLVNHNSGQVIPLSWEKDNIIGRGVGQEDNPTAAILLPDPRVSKKHARIYLDPTTQRWYFEDYGKHPSRINDRPVVQAGVGLVSYDDRANATVQLSHGDVIAIGAFTLVFYEKFRADATLEMEKPNQPPFVKEWDAQELSPVMETIAMAILIVTAVIVLCCFLW